MEAKDKSLRTDDCPECRGTGLIGAANCSSCDATGKIIVHSHRHSHGDTAHEHPHHHQDPHHPDDETVHGHRH